ncbi:DUF3566 domain-containing protein [Bifidobacterium oedipodis]|uniref:DUF3566 domain-containing protein n=1 Tax=Bifidobacterium oedipodis TaxID=2675322 RepID=A0A7Y0EQY2_9BIFI|nr:DUF3566 domain-containing protein [Bifidobacterium sp. DSM 109957]NMM94797.1 hypothetical protein [Bifidobacterium sp. DSM 109957]
MSENLEDNEPVTIEPNVDDNAHDVVDPLIEEKPETTHAPRVARSVSSGSEESGTTSGTTTVRPAKRRSIPRARRMSLSLTRVDAWSVAKVSFMLSIAGAIIQIVAATLLWLLLDVVGVFGQITQIVSSTGLDAGGFDLTNVLSLTTVVSAVTIFSIIEVILITLLATIVALIYNVVSSLVGGIHVTLGDD